MIEREGVRLRGECVREEKREGNREGKREGDRVERGSETSKK